MRRIKIQHSTTYCFGVVVELGPHQLMIRPREGHDVRMESSLLLIQPAHEVKWRRDIEGNSVGTVRFLEPAAELAITSEVIIQHFEEEPGGFELSREAVLHPFSYASDELINLIPYLTNCYPEDLRSMQAWISSLLTLGNASETFQLLFRLNVAIANDFKYARRDAAGVQSPGETLRLRRGSCRDFATLFIEACRCLGIASRFVSGYLYTTGISGLGGSTHAWAEVYLPGAGWIGFDSTTGTLTGTSHIAVAVSRHPAGVPPISGSFIGPGGTCPSLWVGVGVWIL